MTSLRYQPESPASSRPPRVQLELIRFPDPLLDGSWWPNSTDLGVELPLLLPVLDHVRGPVTRLLLSVGNWTARPHWIVTDGRTVSIGYAAGQSPKMIKVFCVDGGTFTTRVAPPGPAPGASDPWETRRDEEVWEGEGGRLTPLPNRAVR
jgi:hypothetical protein